MLAVHELIMMPGLRMLDVQQEAGQETVAVTCRVEKPHPPRQLGHCSIIIMQHAAEYFTALNGPSRTRRLGIGVCCAIP